MEPGTPRGAISATRPVNDILRVLFFCVFAGFVVAMTVVGHFGISMGTQTFERAVIILLAYIGMSILLGQDDG